ncbi:MAG TPA: hypothetical protein VGP62_25660 [Bryobacteraceae bacterium]|jgi:hypothetical protein|nr:hypothetical protein [Bryobacteraceae bacterium]
MLRWVVLLLLVPAMMFGQYRNRHSGSVPAPPSASPDFKDVVATFAGVLKNVSKKEITIDLDESHEIMTFRRTKETKFTDGESEVKATSIDLESHVIVDAKQDPDSKLRAVAVKAGQEVKKAAK